MSWKDCKKSGKIFYTILTYNKSVSEIINKIKDDLDKVNKRVKDSFKRKIINERLYPLIKLLESSYKGHEILNCIILAGNELHNFELTKDELNICKKWELKEFFITYDDKFKIGYLKNLLSEEKINLIFELNNENLKIIEMDNLKSRIISKNKIENQANFIELCNSQKPKMIHGSGSFIKKIKKSNDNIHLKKLGNNEIIDIINKLEIESSQNILKMEVLDQITNPSFEDKFLFGKKEVGNGILDYTIKKLYITPSLWRQLKKNTPSEYLNFKVLEVDKLESGDIGDKFISDYSGIIALKYY